jgi:hypothetical protein
MQNRGQGLQPVAYLSQRLSNAQGNYAPREKEMLAVVEACTKFRHLILGNKFTVYSDHKSLSTIYTQRELKGRLQRWAYELQEFNIDVVYVPGPENTAADYMSRRDAPKRLAIISTVQPSLADEIRTLGYEGYRRKKARFEEDDGVLYLNGRICIPIKGEIRARLIRAAHELGHFGAEKVYNTLVRSYFWPAMWEEVQRTVQSCDRCAQGKASTQAPAGKLRPLPTPKGRWEAVSLDFFKVNNLCQGYNTIMVVVDQFTRRVVLVPTTDKLSATEAARLFINNVVCRFGQPSSITCDRDPRFVATIWEETFKLLGTTMDMTTANHQSANGLVERMNKTVKQVLLCKLGTEADWVAILPVVELAINSTVNKSTGLTPFELDTGRNPSLPFMLSKDNTIRPPPEGSTEARAEVEALRGTLEAYRTLASQNREAAKDAQETQANKDRRLLSFKVGDKVMIRSEAFNLHKAVSGFGKLISPFVGPFAIVKTQPERDNYEVQLPPTWRHHPVFHVSKLKRVHAGPLDATSTRPGPVSDDSDGKTFAVERILASRVRGGQRRYLILWKGYPLSDAEWVKQVDVGLPLIKEFEDAQRALSEELNNDDEEIA